MAFEYDGKIYLNLEEQVEVNSRMAVDAKEAADAATEAVSNKMDKVPSAFTGGIPTINMDGSLTNSNRSFTVRYGTTQQGGQTVYTNALIPTEKATVDFLNDNYTKSADITTALEGKVDKVTGIKSVYTNNSSGNVSVLPYTASATENTIAYRSTGGVLSVGTPTSSSNAATKGYVDNKFIAKSTATGVVYINNTNGNPSTLAFTNSATGSTVVTRTAGGQVKCAAPVDGEAFHNDAAINRSYADDRYTKKQTTTSTAKRAYAYDNTGDINVVISADNANGGTIVQRTGAGRIVCNDPNAAGQAATKGYVDNLISSAVIDLNGSNIDTVTTGVGLKIYAAMQTFGFFVTKHTSDGTIFGRPLTDSEVTIPANTFAFSAIKATSTGLTDSYSSGLYYTVDSTGVVTAVV